MSVFLPYFRPPMTRTCEGVWRCRLAGRRRPVWPTAVRPAPQGPRRTIFPVQTSHRWSPSSPRFAHRWKSQRDNFGKNLYFFVSCRVAVGVFCYGIAYGFFWRTTYPPMIQICFQRYLVIDKTAFVKFKIRNNVFVSQFEARRGRTFRLATAMRIKEEFNSTIPVRNDQNLKCIPHISVVEP